MPVTTTQARAAIEIVLAMADAIRDLKQVPSGTLYATVCGKLTLDDYNAIIRTLKGAGVVTEAYNLLTWVGPAKEG